MSIKRPPATPLGEWLDTYCAQEHLTYTDIARHLQCSSAFLSALRNGRKNLSEDLLRKLAQWLQDRQCPVTLEELDRLNQVSGPLLTLPLSQCTLAERKRLIRTIYWTVAERTLDR